MQSSSHHYSSTGDCEMRPWGHCQPNVSIPSTMRDREIYIIIIIMNLWITVVTNSLLNRVKWKMQVSLSERPASHARNKCVPTSVPPNVHPAPLKSQKFQRGGGGGGGKVTNNNDSNGRSHCRTSWQWVHQNAHESSWAQQINGTVKQRLNE